MRNYGSEAVQKTPVVDGEAVDKEKEEKKRMAGGVRGQETLE